MVVGEMWLAKINVLAFLAVTLIWAEGVVGDCDFSCSVNETSEAKCIDARWVMQEIMEAVPNQETSFVYSGGSATGNPTAPAARTSRTAGVGSAARDTSSAATESSASWRAACATGSNRIARTSPMRTGRFAGSGTALKVR